MRVLVLDPRLAEPVAGLGHDVVGEPGDDGEILVLGGGDGLRRLEALRERGEARPAVLLLRSDEELPPRRALLEPLYVLRSSPGPELERALLSLGRARAVAELRLPRGVLSLSSGRLSGPEGVEELSPLELNLLAYLAARPGRDLSREELQQQVWGHRKVTVSRAVDMSVVRLRRKVELDPANPRCLITVPQHGYRLEPLVRPPPTTPIGSGLVGRDALLLEILEELDRGRPVELSGPPGVGKTGLARAALQLGAQRFGFTAHLDLAHLRSRDELSVSLYAALGLSRPDGIEQIDEIERALARALRARGRGLLVVDNAEHLLSDARLFVLQLREGCPELALLLTSRVWMGIPGSWARAVDPLPPEDARTLLHARARQAGAELTPGAAEDALLEALDGLPLAIELAAARLRLWSAEEIGRQLSNNLDALVDQTRPARHRSLRAALSASVETLDPALQEALGALSVHEGAFDLASAGALLGEVRAPALLEELLLRSLLQRQPGTFRMLDSVRAFAREVAPPDVIERARGLHARHYAALAREETVRCWGWQAPLARARLNAASGELRAAWERLREEGSAELIDVAVGQNALWRTWGLRPLRHQLLSATLARCLEIGDLAGAARASLYRSGTWPHAQIMESLGDLDRAAELAERAGDLATLADALIYLAPNRDLASREGVALLDRAEDLARQIDDQPRQAHARAVRAQALSRRGTLRLRESAPQVEAALVVMIEHQHLLRAAQVARWQAGICQVAGMWRETSQMRALMARIAEISGEQVSRTELLLWEAEDAHLEGELERSLTLLERARAEEYGDRPAVFWNNWARRRGWVLVDQGRLGEARHDFDDALESVRVHRGAIIGEAVAGRVAVSLERGELSAARAELEQTLAARELMQVTALCQLDRYGLLAALMEADAEAARRHLEAIPPDLTGDDLAVILAFARGALCALEGDASGLQAARESARAQVASAQTYAMRQLARLLPLLDGPLTTEALDALLLPPTPHEVRLLARGLAACWRQAPGRLASR